MKTRLLFVAAMLSCLGTTEARLSACECVGPISPCIAAEDAQAVFVGQVVGITPVTPPATGETVPPMPFLARRVSFKVTESLRGGVDDTVEVYTGSGGGDCGFSFSKGKSYLVYARRAASGQLTTGICARTREATRGAEGEIKELRLLAQEPRKCRQS
jgi:hypothetical protein